MSNEIAHLALQPTAVIDATVSPYPELPLTLLNIPGVTDWWSSMKLVRERDKETLFRLILTKIAGGIAGETSSGINKFTVIGKSTINPTANINIVTGTTTGGGGPGPGGTAQESEDALFLAWTGL
jgi:hypothetical protein